jgi:flagellar assembly protein FliH
MALIRSQPVPGQAAALVQASAQRAERAVEERVREAHAAGHQAGLAEAQARIEAAERRAAEADKRAAERISTHQKQCEERLGKAAAALESAARKIAGLERQLCASAEAEIVRLALAVAARVLAREVEADPAWMRTLVQTALADLPDRRRVELRLSPRDAEAAKPLLASASEATGTDRLDLVADPHIPDGSLVLNALGTRLDATVSSSWERVARTLLDAAPKPPLAMDAGGQAVDPPA